MKKSSSKILLLIIIVVIIVGLSIAAVFMLNSNKTEDTNNGGQQVATSGSSYDGTAELGTPMEFTINKVTLPEKVGYQQSFEVDGNTWYYSLDAEGNAINIYTYGDFSGDVIIPDMLDGHKVISIGKIPTTTQNTLFYTSLGGEQYWNNITSITVPEGVKYINPEAFYGFDNLKTVTLPDSIIYIGSSAFESCKNLESINSDIPGKVVMPKNLQYYGESLFRGTYKINAFEFPEQINYIQSWTFYETHGFSDVTIPGQFKYIGIGAFASSDTTSLTVEEGVQIIGNSAFTMNKELTRVNLPNTVQSIGTDAFSLCTLLNEFNYNGKLSYIGKKVFDYTNVKDALASNQLP